MENSQFRKPLMQSAAIIAAVLVLFALISSSGADGSAGGVLALFSGIGNLILFFIGLGIALPFSIAILIAIFLGAVALQSPKTASEMYSDLKKNFSDNLIAFKEQWSCCTGQTGFNVSAEDYEAMKEEIAHLMESSDISEGKIVALNDKNISLDENISFLSEENIALKEQFNQLSKVVQDLQESEDKLSKVVNTLSKEISAEPDTDLKEQIGKLEVLQNEANSSISELTERLNSLNANIKQSPSTGIFSYIESDEDQTLFTMTIEEGVAQEMTYSQIDEFLTNNLSPELDKIIKDHPSLTKTYIRKLRKD